MIIKYGHKFLLLLFLLSVVGCFWSPDKASESHADEKVSFRIKSTKVTRLDEKNLSPENQKQHAVDDSVFALFGEKEFQFNSNLWQGDKIASYNIQICLNDVLQGSAIKDQKFRIEDLNDLEKPKVVQSNEDGCVKWTVRFPFEYFADATYVLFKNKIVGMGAFTGSTDLKFAINPWSSRDKTGAEVIFPDFDNIDMSSMPLVSEKQKIIAAIAGEGQKKPIDLTPFKFQVKAQSQAVCEPIVETVSNNYLELEALKKKINSENRKLISQGKSCDLKAPYTMEICKTLVDLESSKKQLLTVIKTNTRKRSRCHQGMAENNELIIDDLSAFVKVKNIRGEEKALELEKGEFQFKARMMEASVNSPNNFVFIDQDTELEARGLRSMSTVLFNPGSELSALSKDYLKYAQVVDDSSKIKVKLDKVLLEAIKSSELALVLFVAPKHTVLAPNFAFFAAGKSLDMFSTSSTKALKGKIIVNHIDKDKKDKRPKRVKQEIKISDFGQGRSSLGEISEVIFPGLDQEKRREAFRNSDARAKMSFYGIAELQPRFLGITSGESSTTRGVEYRVSTMIQNRDGSLVKGYPFRVTITNEATGEVQKSVVFTNKDTGELTWNGSLWHKHFAPEHYFHFTLKFEELDYNYYYDIAKEVDSDSIPVIAEVSTCGAQKSCGYYINPWDEKWTFGVDSAKMSEANQVKNKIVERVRSRFFLPDFNYHTLRFRYEVDKNLNLKVKKTVLMRLQPRMLRYSSQIMGRLATYALRDGIYLMKIAMEKSYLDPSNKGFIAPLRPEWCHIDPATTTFVRQTYVDNKELQAYMSENEIKSLDDDRLEEFVKTKAKTSDLCMRDNRSYFEKLATNANHAKFKTRRHITVAKKLVRVINNQIITPVEFEVNDLRLMRIRSNMMIQFELIDEYRLLMANTYDDFYEQQIQAILEKKELSKSEIESLVNEKTENLKVIIDKMTSLNDSEFHKERMVHNFIDQKRRYYSLNRFTEGALVEKNEKGEFTFKSHQELSEGFDIKEFNNKNLENGIKYVRYCEASAKITWPEVFHLFDIKQNKLDAYVKTHLNTYNYQAKNEYNAKADCVVPENVLSAFNFNDFIENKIRPIPNIDFDSYIDYTSKVSKETFVGPVTFLHNGNSSNLRPTRNLEEVQCTGNMDCSQAYLQSDFQESYLKAVNAYSKKYETIVKAAEGEQLKQLLALFGIKNKDEFEKHLEAIKDVNGIWFKKLADLGFNPKKYDEKDNSGYERSSYFNSIEHLNNVQVDDLIQEAEKLETLQAKYMKISRLPYQYLRQFNLKYVSLNDSETVKFFDSKKCPDITDFSLKPKAGEKSFADCLTPAPDAQISQEIFLKKGEVKKVNTPLDDLISLFSEAEEKPSFSGQQVGDFVNSSQGVLSEGMVNQLCHYFEKKYSQIVPVPFNGGFLYNCKKQFREKRKNGILALSRRLVVEDTGKYFFKGGKSLNINVGSSFGLGYSESISNSWGAGLTTPDLIKNLMPKWSPIDMPKWSFSHSRSNSLSDSISIASATFLVMQDAVLDIMLTRYRQCVVVSFGESNENLSGAEQDLFQHLNRSVYNKTKSFQEHYIRNGRSEEEALSQAKYKVHDLLSGLMICDDKITENQPKAIREHYYYFTQHFTEGDMLDPADIYNHPWLLMLRGKADMWRFIDLIKATPSELHSGNYITPKGKITDTPTWPIEQLIDAYSGVMPSFPGVFTINHDEDLYRKDFPWNTAPRCSFNVNSFDQYSEKVQELLNKMKGLPRDVTEQIHALSNTTLPMDLDCDDIQEADIDLSVTLIDKAIKSIESYKSMFEVMEAVAEKDEDKANLLITPILNGCAKLEETEYGKPNKYETVDQEKEEMQSGLFSLDCPSLQKLKDNFDKNPGMFGMEDKPAY